MPTPKYKAFISYKHSELGRSHAVALETGLKRYAKPLFQRPMSIFRDEKHMVPSNELSKLITDGLEQSEYLIFLAEKQAAESIWCRQELEYWCETLGRKDQLIIIHIADLLVLDVENNKVDWQKTEALPDLLQKYIPAIPLYVDLTWAATKEMLSLDNIRYKPIINLIKAKLRGVAPEELNDLELKVFRRNRRLRTGAIIVLSILLVVSVIASLFARSQTIEAQKQRKNALTQEGIARDSAVSAQNQRFIAEEQRNIARLQRDTARIERDRARIAQSEAERQRDIALSRQLAALANNEFAVDPSVSLALAVEAMQLKRTDQARQMLQTALLQSHVYRLIKEHTAEISQVAFLPEQNQAFTVGLDGKAILWGLNNSAATHRLEGYRGVVSEDGKYALTSVQDGQIKLWDLTTGTTEASFLGHEETINALAISSDNQLLASGSTDKTVKIYNRESGQLVGEPIEMGGFISSLAFSPDRRFIAIGAFYNKAAIWDLTEGKLLLSTTGYQIAFSPDGKWLATGGGDDTGIRLVNLRTGKVTKHFGTNTGSIQDIAFSPDSKLLATASSKREAHIWTLSGDQQAVLSGHTNWVKTVDWSPNGQFVLTGSQDFTARVWSIKSGRSLAVLRGHKDDVTTARFSPDGTHIISGAKDGEVRLWDIKGAIPERINQGSRRTVQQVQFIHKNQYAIVAGDDITIQLWNLSSNAIEQEFPGDVFAVSSDEQWFATASAETDIQIWSLPMGRLQQTFPGHEDYITGLAFSPDERFLVSASEDKSVRIHALTEQAPAKSVLPHKAGLSGIAFSPDGRFLATSDYEDQTCLWTWPALEEQKKLHHESSIWSTSFNHSGKLLATGTSDGQVSVWSVPSGKLNFLFQTGKGSINDLAFSPRDDKLFIAGASGSIEVRDVRTGKLVSTLLGPSDGFYRIAVDPAERYLVGSSNDHTVWMWDLKTWNPISTLAVHGNAVYALALSSDGQKIMTGSEDGAAHVYPCQICLSDRELLRKAKQRLSSAPPPAGRVEELTNGQ